MWALRYVSLFANLLFLGGGGSKSSLIELALEQRECYYQRTVIKEIVLVTLIGAKLRLTVRKLSGREFLECREKARESGY